MFLNTIKLVFNYPVDMDECVNELYIYLLRDDAAKLRGFEGRSSFGTWLKKVCIRFFIALEKSRKVIENQSHEAPYNKGNGGGESSGESSGEEIIDTLSALEAKEDLERLFRQMDNERYVAVIRALVLEDREPAQIARFMGITVANLYNIKKRALDSLARIAMAEKGKYERK